MIVQETVVFPLDHPAMPGHFPGDPIVPGAVLLDQAAGLARRQGGWRITGIRKARFKAPVRPGIGCDMRLAVREDGVLELTCSIGQDTVMVATLDYTACVETP